MQNNDVTQYFKSIKSNYETYEDTHIHSMAYLWQRHNRMEMGGRDFLHWVFLPLKCYSTTQDESTPTRFALR
jgi:hypothetical protein